MVLGAWCVHVHGPKYSEHEHPADGSAEATPSKPAGRSKQSVHFIVNKREHVNT